MEIHSKTDIYVNNVRTLTRAINYEGITIPSGFSWDGISIPKAITFIIPRWGEANMAALVHDFLYSTESVHSNRKEADNILYDTLKELGVPWWKAYVIYISVRVFGKSSYKKVGI
jgi:hypothetical protein